MTTSPEVSIIVATYRRGTMLLETIESIRSQRDVSFELIIVDQTSDHSEEIIAKLTNLDRIGAIRWIREGIPNLPRARNIGLSLARAEIIVYLDDDVLLPDGFLKRHLAHFSETGIDAVIGMILHPGESPSDRPKLPWAPNTSAQRIDRQIMRYRTPMRNPSHFVGANMSFRRSTLLSLDGFNHFFQGSALGEDTELAARLHRAGYTSIYDPRCWLMHRVAEEGGCRDGDVDPFRRMRSRLRNYYFSIWHGFTYLQATRLILHRWANRFLSRPRAGSASENRRRISQRRPFAALAGRFVGAFEGMALAWRKRAIGGQLSGLLMEQKATHSQSIRVSIVIPTFNREAPLVHTISSLLADPRGDVEIIVVDQSPTHQPETLESLKTFGEDPRFRLIKEQVPNASRARNIGIRAAKAPVVLFLDDDITPSPQLVDRHLQGYDHPQVSAVGGRIVWGVEELESEDPAGFDAWQAAEWPELPVCYTSTPFPDALHVITCNMSARRDRLYEVGGFNEWFRGYGEDIELVARLREAGGRVRYDPSAAVVHHSSPTGGTRQRGLGAFAFGYRRSRDQSFSILCSVGYCAWVCYLLRRQFALMGRLSGQQSQTGHAGPVARMLRSKKPLPLRILSVAGYKVPHLFGAFFGTFAALWLWMVTPDRQGSLIDNQQGGRS